MSMLDAAAPNFRRARDRWPTAPTLEAHYNAVVEGYEGSAHGLIATIKSFVECVCLTILSEHGKALPNSDPSTTQLLVEALKTMGLEQGPGAGELGSLLSAHNKLADALAALRNHHDPVAHGRDGFLDTLTTNERRAFLITADTVVALLLAAHDGTEPDIQFTRQPYERFHHLHARVDRSLAVLTSVEDEAESQIVVLKLRSGSQLEDIELRLEPSRLLYAVDREAYVEVLNASVPLAGGDDVLADVSTPKAGDHSPSGAVADPAGPTVEFTASYSGRLAELKGALSGFLETLGVASSAVDSEGARLTDSLLVTAERNMGIDWVTRDSQQAALRVALKRLLVRFAIDPKAADQTAGQVASWLKIQARAIE